MQEHYRVAGVKEKYFCVAEPTDNASVSFVKYKSDYYVSTETNFMHRVNPENLKTTERVRIEAENEKRQLLHSSKTNKTLCHIVLKVDWSKFIAVNGATAHPHYDPDGTTYNMGNSYGSKGESFTHT